MTARALRPCGEHPRRAGEAGFTLMIDACMERRGVYRSDCLPGFDGSIRLWAIRRKRSGENSFREICRSARLAGEGAHQVTRRDLNLLDFRSGPQAFLWPNLGTRTFSSRFDYNFSPRRRIWCRRRDIGRIAPSSRMPRCAVNGWRDRPLVVLFLDLWLIVMHTAAIKGSWRPACAIARAARSQAPDRRGERLIGDPPHINPTVLSIRNFVLALSLLLPLRHTGLPTRRHGRPPSRELGAFPIGPPYPGAGEIEVSARPNFLTALPGRFRSSTAPFACQPGRSAAPAHAAAGCAGDSTQSKSSCGSPSGSVCLIPAIRRSARTRSRRPRRVPLRTYQFADGLFCVGDAGTVPICARADDAMMFAAISRDTPGCDAIRVRHGSASYRMQAPILESPAILGNRLAVVARRVKLGRAGDVRRVRAALEAKNGSLRVGLPVRNVAVPTGTFPVRGLMRDSEPLRSICAIASLFSLEEAPDRRVYRPWLRTAINPIASFLDSRLRAFA